MLKIYGFPTFNTQKVLYVATQLNMDFEYVSVDPTRGDNKTSEYLKLHPLGKVPAITHDSKPLFESGAICRYLADLNGSTLYPRESYSRALIDQWMDFFSCHLGRWLGAVYFEQVIRPLANLGPAKTGVVDEAQTYIAQQTPLVEQALKTHAYVAGDTLSIADFFAFAYLEVSERTDVDLTPWSAISQWYEKMKALPAVEKVRQNH